MFANSDELLKYIKDEGVEMVDVRFCDLPGVMQHFTVPVSSFDQAVFDDGLNFDGSSIRGFQAIHESDMSLFPDPTTAYLDPFRAAKTLVVNFFIHDPLTGEAYSPRPAQHRRARPRPTSPATGIGDTAYFAPEAEFYVFDDVRFETKAERRLLPHRLRGGRLEHRRARRAATAATRSATRAATSRSRRTTTSATCATRWSSSWRSPASPSSAPTTRSAPPARPRSTTSFDELLKAADDVMKFKYIVKNVAWRNGKTATFMPKPIFGDNGSGMHCHQSIWKDGEPLFYDETGYAGLSDIARYYIGGLLKHAPSLLAFTNPTVNSYHRLVPGFEAPVNLVYSQRNRSACVRIPITGSNPKAKRIEFRCPDPSANPYLAFSAHADGRPRRHQEQDRAAGSRSTRTSTSCRRTSTPTIPTGARLARRGARRARGRPRVPARGRRLHRRPDRDLDRLQAHQRDRPDAAAPAPARVRALLRHLRSDAGVTSSNRTPAMARGRSSSRGLRRC